MHVKIEVFIAIITILPVLWIIFAFAWSQRLQRNCSIFSANIKNSSFQIFTSIKTTIQLSRAGSCPDTPPDLLGTINVTFISPSFNEISAKNPNILNGGRFRPTCDPIEGATAIIIPYRNRDNQLRTFLHHIHPILQRQLIEYTIFVVEQEGDGQFNRALLLNIGYLESQQFADENINKSSFQCYIFHDVDLLPESDLGIYTCKSTAIHLSGYVDKFNYNLPYQSIFGGVSAIPDEFFKRINGYPNIYFGWGGEDDDMWLRLSQLKLPVTRYSKNVLKYTMIKHGREFNNRPNRLHSEFFRTATTRMYTDGLSSIKYRVVKTERLATFTRILAEIDENATYTAVFGDLHKILKSFL